MSFDFTEHAARIRLARFTGAVYLVYIAASVVADLLGHIGLGTAQQMYAAIQADELSFRAGLVVALLSAFLFAIVAWGLYLLLRPVNRDLALLFLLLNAVGVAIQCASMLPLISAVQQGQAAGFSAAQLQTLGLLSAGTYKTGFLTAQLFFGTWLFPLGYLVYASRFLPRWLGALLMLDGAAVMIWFVQGLVFPAYRAVSTPGLVVSFFAEFGLALWLLVIGIKEGPSSAEARAVPAPRGAAADL